MVKLRKPKHLTVEQWETLVEAGKISDRLAQIEASVELFYNQRYGLRSVGGEPIHPILALKLKERAKLWNEFNKFTSTQEYRDAVNADTCPGIK
jgi:hypothetical protein